MIFLCTSAVISTVVYVVSVLIRIRSDFFCKEIKIAFIVTAITLLAEKTLLLMKPEQFTNTCRKDKM